MYNTIQKTIAAWAFNHYIAYYYFDNVNVSQLKVAFEKGEVELKNLPIKKDALHHFNLPMEVVSGVVGNLSIKVPILTMLTDPWIIKIKNLMLVVTPRKQKSISEDNNPTSPVDESLSSSLNDQSHIEFLQENYGENLDSSILDSENDETAINSEETKLAEFYSSFSAAMSAIVKDIYKNIRLEVESMTILFEEFDHGLVKFNVNNLLLHRPKSVRNLILDNLSIYLSEIGLSSTSKGDDLLRINIEKCNLDIYDETSNNMQLVVVQPQDNSNASSNSSSSPKQSATTSETRVEGNLQTVTIEQLTKSANKGCNEKFTRSQASVPNDITQSGVLTSKRNILKCDTLRVEFKLNNNIEDELVKSLEKNLHIKLDLLGMQYIHSQRIYELTSRRLTNLLKFYIKLNTKKSNELAALSNKRRNCEGEGKIKKRDDAIFNKLMIINIEEGLLYVVDDTVSESSVIPLLEFSLEDCRILQFSGKYQQNGFVFAKVGSNCFNREVSTWDTLLQPWPFSLTWDLKSSGTSSNYRGKQFKNRKISLNSDEIANFTLTSALLDVTDIALKKIVDDFISPKMSLVASRLCSFGRGLAQDFNSLFVLHNETGHKLHFAPLEQHSELYEIRDSSTSSPTMKFSGDTVAGSLNKISLNSRSSNGSTDSPDLNSLARWISIGVGETASFEFDTLPIYRRHISNSIPKSRILLVRVEGWKTLVPISLDKTGLYFREAYSDRVMNEDTYVVISIDLEEKSARKIISIRSPLNLINQLDTTLEVHFAESKQALYIKPESHLAVPLPYLHNRMHIRACNVGVTMSEQPLLWDHIATIADVASKNHICHPISVTNHKHASYCPSLPYRVCVSTKREGLQFDEVSEEEEARPSIPVFSMSFIPPLTIVNLLPCKLQYFIGSIEGSLNKGTQQKIYHVDTTKPTEVYFTMNGFPQSKAINIDPGATGNFYQTLEMVDKNNRSLYLTAKVIIASQGEEPAVEVIIFAPFWFINKTRLPLIFKQEGAILEAAGQFREHEETASSVLLFSFYDTEMEPPWLCSARLGKSKGSSMWCDGFKLDKGSGERRICFVPNNLGTESKMNKSLIDIDIRRGFGRYSQTMVVTFTARYGFDPLTKTPKKTTASSPQNYKLTSYNHNTNLAERIAGQAVSLFNGYQQKIKSDINLILPGLKLTLVDSSNEEFLQGSIKNISLNCTTNSKEQIVDCSIEDIRLENMLPDCEKANLLNRDTLLEESINIKPAIRLIVDRILGNSFGTTLFKQVQLSLCELVLNIEEKLVLKLVEFVSFRNRRQEKTSSNLEQDLDKILHPEDDRLSKYYFGLLRIDLSSLKLSVFTTATLNQSLQKLKSYLGLKFFSFEDAQVQLAPYLKMSVSKTFRGAFESVMRFYKRQMLDQAPRIVGQQIQTYLRFHLSDLLSTLYDEVYNKLFN